MAVTTPTPQAATRLLKVHPDGAEALAIIALGQTLIIILYKCGSLKMSSDFWLLASVIRKRGREILVTSPSGEGRLAVIALKL